MVTLYIFIFYTTLNPIAKTRLYLKYPFSSYPSYVLYSSHLPFVYGVSKQNILHEIFSTSTEMTDPFRTFCFQEKCTFWFFDLTNAAMVYSLKSYNPRAIWKVKPQSCPKIANHLCRKNPRVRRLKNTSIVIWRRTDACPDG